MRIVVLVDPFARALAEDLDEAKEVQRIQVERVAQIGVRVDRGGVGAWR